MDNNDKNLQNGGTDMIPGKNETKEGLGSKIIGFVKKCGRGIKRAAKTKVGKVVIAVSGLAASGYVGFKAGQHSSVPAQITIQTSIPEENSEPEETQVEEPELGEIQENLDSELSEL